MNRLEEWTQRWKPAARAQTHLLAAAILWTVVGLGLLAAGLAWCFGSALPWSAVFAAGGIAAGILKGRFIILKMARRNAARIITRGDDRCLGGFLSVKTWLVVAVMM